MTPATVELDVTAAVPFPGRHHVSTLVFAPSKPAERVPLLFCLRGGSYTKAYWHLEVPGHPGYSFGEHLAAQGMLVVAVDHLGTGESSRHRRAIDLTPEAVAGANAAAFAEILQRAEKGSLLPGLGPLTPARPSGSATRWAPCSPSTSSRCIAASTPSLRWATAPWARS